MVRPGLEKSLGKNHPSTLSSIASVYSNQGDYSKTLELYGRALAGVFADITSLGSKEQRSKEQRCKEL
jgi:hypothetical protein